MSVHELRTANTGVSDQYQETQLQKWISYFICATIGMVGGAIGVALTIGLMIIVVQMSAIVIFPNSYMLIGVGILFGLGISWLLDRMFRSILPFLNNSQRSLQVVFVFSVLIVLLEGFTFMP
jgi:hypothetical protein